MCNKLYSSYQSMWIHNKKFHNPTIIKTNESMIKTNESIKPKEFRCKYCNKSFKYYQNKWDHEKNYCKNKELKVTETNKIDLLEKEIIKLKNLIPTKKNNNNQIDIINDNIEENKLKDNNVSYIYLIQEREHFEKNNNIFKFGRTTQVPNNKICRLLHYKKGSKILFVMNCNNNKVGLIETNIKKIFKDQFKQHDDGFEHYIGDKDKMMDIIISVIKKDN